MCGIFGYVGEKQAVPILLEGLRTLEYRGYDSAGLYIPHWGAIKAAGPVDNLTAMIKEEVTGNSGISHTRWATHGAPTKTNAHPHHDSAGQIWLVHNGIIENYQELKEDLKTQGHSFESDTDTEVLAKLIGSLYMNNLREAVNRALGLVRGTYGLAVMSEANPEEIVVARMGSPIVLGVSSDGYFVSSDPSSLLIHTKEVVYLDDGEMAIINKDGYEIISENGENNNKLPETIEWDVEAVQKQGFEHFMLKEIHEAPEVIKNTIRGRLIASEGKVKLGGLETVLDKLLAIDRLQIVGCGSAFYAGEVGRYMLEEYAKLPVEVELASEYRYKKKHKEKNGALLAISQSGETADTLASVREGKKMGLLTLGVVNTVGSTIARETEAGVYNHARPEIAVASTKAFISQLTVMVMLSVLIGRKRGLSKEEGQEIIEGLETLPEVLTQMLADSSHIENVAKKYAGFSNAIFIGRKLHKPVAAEGSLKLKEVTYIHAEAYAGGELKHGPIAMLDKDFAVIALAPQDDVYEKMISNIEEVKARQAPVLALATEGDSMINKLADDVIYLPKVHPILQPIVSTIPLHLLAYYIGVEKGLNVDRPRNLAKSVTVE